MFNKKYPKNIDIKPYNICEPLLFEETTLREYQIVKQIQRDEPNKLINNILKRLYTKMESNQTYSAALSSSVELFLALKYIGKNPTLILGTCGINAFSFPHAWVELNEKIYDLSIYFDTKNNPVLKDKCNVVNPQINRTYQNADVDYFAFQFVDTWELSDLKRVVGANFKEYCDNNPNNNMWSDICYILDISPVPEKVNKIKELAEKEIINETDNSI